MRKTLRSVAVAVSAAALLVTGMGTTASAAPPVDPGRALERAGILHDGVDGPGANGKGKAKGHLKRDAGGEVNLDGLVVRSDTIAGHGRTVAAGTEVIPDAVPSVDGVVQTLEDGVRLLTIIKDNRAATEYAYTFPGAVLTAQEDGSVLVDGEGDNDYTVDPAWAVDADGVVVQTRYEITGDTLVQVVEHAGAAYPVVADPYVSWGWFRVYLTFYPYEVRQMAPYAWGAHFGNLICVPLANPYLVGACMIAVNSQMEELANTFRTAARYGQCVRTTHLLSGFIVGWRRLSCQ